MIEKMDVQTTLHKYIHIYMFDAAIVVFSASSLAAKHTTHHLMSIVPYHPVGEPWWQVEDWHRGQKRWIYQSRWFNERTESLYGRCLDMRDGIGTVGDFIFQYDGNSRAGPITYCLDFQRMIQTNRRTNQELRIRRVVTVVLDGHPE